MKVTIINITASPCSPFFLNTLDQTTYFNMWIWQYWQSDSIKPCSTWNNITLSFDENDRILGRADLSESVWPQGLIEAWRLIAADSESRAQGQRRRCSAGNAASRKASGARGPCVSLWPTAEQVKRSDGPELTESRWRSGLQESLAAFAKFTSLRPHARSPKAKTWLFQEKVNAWITRKHLRRISNHNVQDAIISCNHNSLYSTVSQTSPTVSKRLFKQDKSCCTVYQWNVNMW